MKETLREREMGQESTAQGISKAGTEERQRRLCRRKIPSALAFGGVSAAAAAL